MKDTFYLKQEKLFSNKQNIRLKSILVNIKVLEIVNPHSQDMEGLISNYEKIANLVRSNL